MAGRPREFEKKETLQKAVQVFHAKGYEGASLDDLCGAMQINRPSLYRAYGNKEKLFLSVLEAYAGPFEQRIRQVLDKNSDIKQAVEALLQWLAVQNQAQQPPLGCMIVNAGNVCGPEFPAITNTIQSLHDRREQILRSRLQRAQEEGQLKPSTDISALAQYLNGVMQGMGVLSRGQAGSTASQSIIHFVTQTLDPL